MTAAVAVACGAFGLAIGSFLNVVIHRVPQHVSVVRPPSRCPGCEEPIAPRDNVPVLSWVLLRGRCRHCGRDISARYPFVELLTAALFVAVAIRFDGSWEVIPYCIGFAGLVALSFIDIDTHLLPKRLVWPVTAAVAVGFAAIALLEDRWDDFQRALLGGAVSSAAIGLIWFVYPRGMGFGDVRLEVLLGLLTGWISRGSVLAAFLIAFVVSGAYSIVVLVLQGLRARKQAIPFGPWLCAGCVVAVLWSASGRWLEENEIRPAIDALKTIF